MTVNPFLLQSLGIRRILTKIIAELQCLWIGTVVRRCYELAKGFEFGFGESLKERKEFGVLHNGFSILSYC